MFCQVLLPADNRLWTILWKSTLRLKLSSCCSKRGCCQSAPPLQSISTLAFLTLEIIVVLLRFVPPCVRGGRMKQWRWQTFDFQSPCFKRWLRLPQLQQVLSQLLSPLHLHPSASVPELKVNHVTCDIFGSADKLRIYTPARLSVIDPFPWRGNVR